MKFLLDENFPCSCAEVIVSCGHEAVPFAEICKFGDDDETVFAAAQRLGAVLLTSDRDFYHTMPLLHPEHSGIVVVALRQPNRAAIQARLMVPGELGIIHRQSRVHTSRFYLPLEMTISATATPARFFRLRVTER